MDHHPNSFLVNIMQSYIQCYHVSGKKSSLVKISEDLKNNKKKIKRSLISRRTKCHGQNDVTGASKEKKFVKSRGWSIIWNETVTGFAKQKVTDVCYQIWESTWQLAIADGVRGGVSQVWITHFKEQWKEKMKKTGKLKEREGLSMLLFLVYEKKAWF